MSKPNWVHDSIIGELPVASPTVPPCPIIDDPRDPLSTYTERAGSSDALIQRCERDAAIEAIMGSDVLALVKKSALRPVDPRVQPSTLTYESNFPDLPAPVGDPRLPQCNCDCQMCRTGVCKNCFADPRCEFSGISVLDDLIPVDPNEQEKLVQVASAAQKARIAKNRILNHRGGLAPIVGEFRSRLMPYSERVPDELFENVLDSAVDYVVANVAATT